MVFNRKINSTITLEAVFYLLISIFLIFVIAWGLTIGVQTHELFEMFNESKGGLFLPLIWIYLVFATVAILGGYYRRNASSVRIISYIFFLAFIPRIIVALFGSYVPASDFANYYKYGVCMRVGDLESVSDIIANYGLPNMGGIAIFNSVLMCFFSTSVVGFAIANGFITSCIGVVIYTISKEFDKNIAFMAGILWAIYPTNVLASSVFDNHHGATLFMLISVWLLYKSSGLHGWKKWVVVALAAMSVVFSDMLHQSGILIVIAVVVFYMLYIYRDIRNKDKSKLLDDLLTLSCYIFVYKGGSAVILSIFKSIGLANATETSIAIYLDKLVCGLDMENRGRSTSISLRYLPEEEQISTGIAILKEDCSSIKELIKLFIDKIDYQWFSPNNLIYFYFKSILEGETIVDDLSIIENRYIALQGLDLIWIRIIYFFSIVGIIIKNNKSKLTDFMILFIFGQVAFFMLTETQSRYRYESEPFLIILAAIGLVTVYRCLKRRVSLVCKQV